MRDFFVRHKCHSAQFYRAAEEFLAFPQDERGTHPDDPPFMLELAHYEWLDPDNPLAAPPETPTHLVVYRTSTTRRAFSRSTWERHACSNASPSTPNLPAMPNWKPSPPKWTTRNRKR